MNRTITVFLLILVGLVVAAAAVEWNETASGAFLRLDPETGEAEVIFSVSLEYDPRPSDSSLVFGWTVYGPKGGREGVLSEFRRSTTLGGPVQRISLASQPVAIVPGETYRGVVTADDEVNGLHYTKTIYYTAPIALPVGISLRGMNGTEEFDLTGVPDEEIEELATIYERLDSDYELIEEGVKLSGFFADYASSSEEFPALVIVIPFLGVESSFGTSNSQVTISTSRILHIYPVDEPAGIPGLTEQLEVYDRDFVGLVFSGGGDEPLYSGVTVFVGSDAWNVLKGASEEEARRFAEGG